MNLLIDIGNTRTKIGLIHGHEFVYFKTISGNLIHNELQYIINHFSQIKGVIISSVVDVPQQVTELASNLCNYVVFDYNTPLPIINRYATPQTLGKDRLAAAVGAWSLYKNTTLLIIDAGTCIKIDVLTCSNEYLGGSISPGIQMRFKALNHFTGKLPLITAEEGFSEFTGTDTKNSILSGVIRGANFEVQGFINHYHSLFPELKIIMTGGDIHFFELEPKNHIFVSPQLVLLGLNEILKFNAQT